MTKTELLEVLRNGESSGTEFKRDTLDNRALAKELVAFANLGGGRLLLGVDDDGSVFGLTREGLEEWVMTACRDKIRPEIIPYFEIIRDAAPGKDVALVQIERGYTVHHLWHNNHRTYYIRAGSQSREASPEELARVFQQRGTLRPEIQPVSGTSIRDLDLRRLSEYFKRIRQQDVPDIAHPDSWLPILVNTEFMTEGDSGFSVTVAGLLLFGSNPNRYLPQAGIDAAVYPGIEKDYSAVDRAAIRGPIVALGEAPNTLDNGLLEGTLQFLRGYISREEIRNGAQRVRRWDYPLEALREAIVNAIVHRDYLLSATTIELSVYSDRLEIVSPGRLPNGINPERMRVGCRAARNQLLKDTMRDYGYVEHMGMGIPRKIIRLLLENNGTDPDLVEEEEQFLLRLWRGPAPRDAH